MKKVLIIDTINHIAQAAHSRYERGESLADLIRRGAREETPQPDGLSKCDKLLVALFSMPYFYYR